MALRIILPVFCIDCSTNKKKTNIAFCFFIVQLVFERGKFNTFNKQLHIHALTPFCAQSEVELAGGFQCVSLLSSVSGASQQLNPVLAIDDTLGLVWTLTPIQLAQVSGCSELAWQ